jgi:hypothetical protein
MKTNPTISKLLALAALLSLNSTAFAQGTAFNYQGRLNDNGTPANGSYDLSFTLCDAVTNGTAIGTLTNTATGVTNGLFTVMLDFGGVFNGSNYWLEIAVRANGGGVFTTLSPRQPMTPTPYAIYSANAGNATTATLAVTAVIAGSANSVSATNIVGAVPAAATATNALNAYSMPQVVLFNDPNHTFTICTNPPFSMTNVYTAPSSTTCGINELQKFFPPNTNGLISGFKLTLAGGEYDPTSPIRITNNCIIDSTGWRASVFNFHVPANGYTMDLVMNDPYDASLFALVTNKFYMPYPPSTEQTAAGNDDICGITIKTSTNMPCILLYANANFAHIHDMGFGGSDFLTTVKYGNQFEGWLEPQDIGVPSGVVAIYLMGAAGNEVDHCFIGGVADGIVVNSSGYTEIHNNQIYTIGRWAGGVGSMYEDPVFGSGAAIYNIASYYTSIHGNITYKAVYDYAPTNSDFIPGAFYDEADQASVHPYQYRVQNGVVATGNPIFPDTLLGFWQNNPVPQTSGLGDLAVQNKIMSDFAGGTVPGITSDGNGNLTAVKFTGSGSGLTGVPASSITGGITTNVLIGGQTFYIINGVIMNIQ